MVCIYISERRLCVCACLRVSLWTSRSGENRCAGLGRRMCLKPTLYARARTRRFVCVRFGRWFSSVVLYAWHYFVSWREKTARLGTQVNGILRRLATQVYVRALFLSLRVRACASVGMFYRAISHTILCSCTRIGRRKWRRFGKHLVCSAQQLRVPN